MLSRACVLKYPALRRRKYTSDLTEYSAILKNLDSRIQIWQRPASLNPRGSGDCEYCEYCESRIGF